MSGYSKLWSEIVTSSIWSADDKTRIVWITLLALKDKDGFVPASIPGLANAARVTLPDCEHAIQVLEAPDPYSRSKEHDGRRIAPCDGGWRVLNHFKYRNKESASDPTVNERVRRFRNKHRASPVTVTDVTDVTDVTRYPVSVSGIESGIGILEGVEGETAKFNAASHDFREPEGIIKAVRSCRPEYAALNEFSIANICQKWTCVGVRAFLIRQWCEEQAAALEPDKNPVAYLNNYLAKRFDSPETKKQMANLDRARRTL